MTLGVPANYYNSSLNDKWVVEWVFPERYDGFFVEAGACDGIRASSCYVLEKYYNWQGICIEPNSFFYPQLAENRPNSVCENLCFPGTTGSVNYVEDLGDDLNPYLSGIQENLRKYKWGGEKAIAQGRLTTRRSLSLYDLLRKHSAPKRIDYLAMGIEGSEHEVLKEFPFDQYVFSAMSLELDEWVWERLRLVLQKAGYQSVENPFNVDQPWEKYLIHESAGLDVP